MALTYRGIERDKRVAAMYDELKEQLNIKSGEKLITHLILNFLRVSKTLDNTEKKLHTIESLLHKKRKLDLLEVQLKEESDILKRNIFVYIQGEEVGRE